MYIELLLLSCILVYVIDCSDFFISLKKILSYILTGGRMCISEYRLRPFDCSFCMIFWLCLVYICIFYSMNIYIFAYICFLSYMNDVIYNIIMCFHDIFLKFINKIYNFFIV